MCEYDGTYTVCPVENDNGSATAVVNCTTSTAKAARMDLKSGSLWTSFMADRG
jgi:hypothetical protein